MKKRSEVDKAQTWAIDDMYKDDEAFKADIKKLKSLRDDFINKYKEFDSSERVIEALDKYSEITALIDKLFTFAGITMEVDATDPNPSKRYLGLSDEAALVIADLSFFESKLARLDSNILDEVKNKKSEYRYFLELIQKKKDHLLSDQTEAVLAKLAPSLDAPYKNYNDMRYGDMSFDDISYGNDNITLNHNTFEEFLEADPREDLRREAFKKYHEVLAKYQHADGSIYNNQMSTEKKISDIRGYESVFHYLLARQDIEFDIYNNHLDVIMDELAPHMRKYAEIIKNHYGLDEMTYADLKLSIDSDYEPKVSFEKARDYILDGLSPLGEDYVKILETAFSDRWIDYAQNFGKRTGAFCASPYLSHPFIMTTYNESMSQVMTLAHELGHAGQGVLSNANQNALAADMSMYFVEAPSTANEITMERYLLNKAKDKRERLWVLSTMIGKTYYHNFVTHFIEAYFQREAYRRIDRGEALTSDDYNQIFKETLEKFWGDSVILNEGSELTWMRQPHYYMGLYSYTYSAGLTIGTLMSDKIVNGEDSDRKNWIEILKLGGSVSPIKLAEKAGVDMTTTKPISEAIEFIGSIIDEIDSLVKELDMYK